MTAPLLEMRGISKRFGGVRAVEDVSVQLFSGEVVGLLGHNGAGKSTLMKVLSGAYRPDAGELRILGESVAIAGPRDARDLGIETIYQELALAENLDACANLFLGRERTNRLGLLDEGAMERSAREVLARLSPDFHALRTPVRQLSGGQRQAVAIARAVHFEARILVMDEPVAALGPRETATVASLVRRLKEEGLGIFLVSHDLRDVFELADRVVVMKSGRVVTTLRTSETSPDEVLERIIAG